MYVSASALGRASGGLAGQLGRVRRRVCRLTNRSFGVNSPHRMNSVLFNGVGVIRGPGGAGAKRCMADRRMLRRLHDGDPVVSRVLGCEKLGGLLKACMSTLPGLVGPHANRVRTSFGRAVATANHLSSDSPGLRGVPIHSSSKGRVEEYFVPRPDYLFFSTSCSRVRLHVVTRLDRSPGVMRTFLRKSSVRTTATTGV